MKISCSKRKHNLQSFSNSQTETFMKSQKGFKAKAFTPDNEDAIRKPAKLEPARKSGKERHTLYGNIDDESDDWSENYDYKKKESVLDYFDDGSDD